MRDGYKIAQQLNNFRILSCVQEIVEICFAYKRLRDNVSVTYCCITNLMA